MLVEREYPKNYPFCIFTYFLPQLVNIFTQIYLPYLWHFATLGIPWSMDTLQWSGDNHTVEIWKCDKPTDSPAQVLEIPQHQKNHDFCQVSRKWESTTRLTLTLCSSRPTHALASGKRSVSSSSSFLPDKNLSPYMCRASQLLFLHKWIELKFNDPKTETLGQ